MCAHNKFLWPLSVAYISRGFLVSITLVHINNTSSECVSTALMIERTRILTNNILDFYLLKQAQISELGLNIKHHTIILFYCKHET